MASLDYSPVSYNGFFNRIICLAPTAFIFDYLLHAPTLYFYGQESDNYAFVVIAIGTVMRPTVVTKCTLQGW